MFIVHRQILICSICSWFSFYFINMAIIYCAICSLVICMELVTWVDSGHVKYHGLGTVHNLNVFV